MYNANNIKKKPETPLLIQFSRLVFENNFLKTEFCGDIFHQTFEIAMGKPFAVTAANAFMYYLEKDVVTQFSNHLLLYKPFIDDICFVWKGPKENLLELLSCLNNKYDLLRKAVSRFWIYFFTKMLILALCSFLPIKSH